MPSFDSCIFLLHLSCNQRKTYLDDGNMASVLAILRSVDHCHHQNRPASLRCLQLKGPQATSRKCVSCRGADRAIGWDTDVLLPWLALQGRWRLHQDSPGARCQSRGSCLQQRPLLRSRAPHTGGYSSCSHHNQHARNTAPSLLSSAFQLQEDTSTLSLRPLLHSRPRLIVYTGRQSLPLCTT